MDNEQTRLKVLVADDDDALRRLVVTTLMDPGRTLLEARDGEEALALARREQPHLILLDVVMPGLSGLAVCRKLRREFHTRAIPVIMLTAHGRPADRERGLSVGADAYLIKPFSPLELLQLAEHMLLAGRRFSLPSAGVGSWTNCLHPSPLS